MCRQHVDRSFWVVQGTPMQLRSRSDLVALRLVLQRFRIAIADSLPAAVQEEAPPAFRCCLLCRAAFAKLDLLHLHPPARQQERQAQVRLGVAEEEIPPARLENPLHLGEHLPGAQAVVVLADEAVQQRLVDHEVEAVLRKRAQLRDVQHGEFHLVQLLVSPAHLLDDHLAGVSVGHVAVALQVQSAAQRTGAAARDEDLEVRRIGQERRQVRPQRLVVAVPFQRHAAGAGVASIPVADAAVVVAHGADRR
eukprot:scaffold1390_cov249-Pinguiococcus_pyrenoidosus.AAC.23